MDFGKKIAIFWQFLAKRIPDFELFPRVPLLINAGKHLGEDFRKFSAETNDKNWSYKSKSFKNWILAKMAIFWQFLAKEIPDFEFSHGYHYSCTLEDT